MFHPDPLKESLWQASAEDQLRNVGLRNKPLRSCLLRLITSNNCGSRIEPRSGRRPVLCLSLPVRIVADQKRGGSGGFDAADLFHSCPTLASDPRQFESKVLVVHDASSRIFANASRSIQPPARRIPPGDSRHSIHFRGLFSI